MCGICGEANLRSGAPPLESSVRAMCRAMHHRGPDGHGDYCDEDVALGSTRLAIIDLPGGAQPIHNEDRSIWVVFNGEIYNFKHLRRQLEHLGHQFYTGTDTECIVHAYEEFGLEFLEHLNGIHALAIWDSRTRRFILARDRVGVKPLYYAITENSLVFASELRVLLSHPLVERKIDLVSLNEYLTYEYVPTPRSIIKGVNKLPPGHMLIMERGVIDVRQYWNVRLERSETGARKLQTEYQRELLERLDQAVESELVSDVPVGLLLSGGLDSSAIAYSAARAYEGRLKTFTVAFEDKSFDESTYARLVADAVGAEHHELPIRVDEMLAVVPKLGELLDEPLGDSSFVPTYMLCRFASQHVKVALGGDGGDELFAGYPTYQAHRLVEYYERIVPGTLRQGVIPSLVSRMPTSFDNISLDFKIKRFISGRGYPLGVRHHQWLGSFTPFQKQELLQPWAQILERDVFEIVSQHQRQCAAIDAVNQLLYWDMKMYLEGDILHKTDRASMVNSLEVRVPLLNHAFVEWVTEIPHSLKIRNLTTKYLFRESLHGRLPKSIIGRPKKGFNMPVAKWLAGPLRELAEDTLAADRLKSDGLFEPRAVRALLDDHYERRMDHRKLIWTLLSFQLWYDDARAGVNRGAAERLVEPLSVH